MTFASNAEARGVTQPGRIASTEGEVEVDGAKMICLDGQSYAADEMTTDTSKLIKAISQYQPDMVFTDWVGLAFY